MSKAKRIKEKIDMNDTISRQQAELSHSAFIKKAEDHLANYEKELAARIEASLREKSGNLAARITDLQKAHGDFVEDPVRLSLLNNLMRLKNCSTSVTCLVKAS